MLTIANVEMAKAWDGEEGDQWTEYADFYEAAGTRIWDRVLEISPIAPADRVLDVGCGTGVSTRAAGHLASAGAVLGVDLSARMLEEAKRRARAEGLTNVEFLQGDAQVHPFEPQSFDLAISDFGAMFFAEPVAAFRNVAAALRPGGRLGLVTWQEMVKNEWLMAIRGALAAGRDLPAPPTGAPGPFGLADANDVRRILDEAGFGEVELEPVHEPMCFGADADDAWNFVGNMGIVHWLSSGLDDATKAQVMADLRALVVAHDTGDGVLFDSAAWVVTARKP